MKVSFSALEIPASGVVVAAVTEDRALSASAGKLDEALGGGVQRAMEASRFHGRKEQTLALLAPAGTAFTRILLVGLGKPGELDPLRLQAAGGQIYAALAGNGQADAFVCVDALPDCTLSPADMAAEMAFGAALRSYRFDKYRTKESEDDKPSLAALTFGCADAEQAAMLWQRNEALAGAIAFTRNIVSEPANVIYPETLAAQARTLADHGVEVEVLGEERMRELGMGALLGVGQGSARESQLVVMQWWGAGKPASSEGVGDDAPEVDPNGPLAFVGKGVTFDTGGISIKPAANMEDMKWDMAGSGVVIGLMKALAMRRAPVNAVGIVGLVENMPSSTAQRPGDVVKSMSGQTIEVINTDAEGRLVLSDALWYTKQRFRPKLMIDLATLTGAIIIALGHEQAGLFSNDEALAERLAAAGKATGELLWRLPLGEAYDKQIKSDIADMKNVGERGAGSITAAQFLQRFVGKTPWAHLDIAGVAWGKKDSAVTPKGATGFGIRLLDRLVADHYEQP
ncbi:MAG: leucyl aminopeptidase [Rhodospirillales bacterium]|nr:leucyl aminopeptidase [Rhodospirillales bacterium]